MAILLQFVYRLTFGMAAAMALTSPRHVTSGYFRNNLYVTLGLSVLATMATLSARDTFTTWIPIAAASLSYAGAVAWLYEQPKLGRLFLALVAAVALYGAIEGPWKPDPVAQQAHSFAARGLWNRLDAPTGGLVLGVTMAAMLLGHWYLNTPTMQLAPLRRLVLLMAVVVAARCVVCAFGLAGKWQTIGPPDSAEWSFLALRWLSGLLGTLLLAKMAWQTLKIPNTQSATGILYVAVIATFLGELTSLLLSRGSAFPL